MAIIDTDDFTLVLTEDSLDESSFDFFKQRGYNLVTGMRKVFEEPDGELGTILKERAANNSLIRHFVLQFAKREILIRSDYIDKITKQRDDLRALERDVDNSDGERDRALELNERNYLGRMFALKDSKEALIIVDMTTQMLLLAKDKIAQHEKIRQKYAAQKRRLRRSIRRVKRDLRRLEAERDAAIKDHELKTFTCAHNLAQGGIAVYHA